MKLRYETAPSGRAVWVDDDHGILMTESEVKTYRELMEKHEAYTGEKATDTEARFYLWLSGWDKSTITSFVGILEKSHKFGYVSGEVDGRHKK